MPVHAGQAGHGPRAFAADPADPDGTACSHQARRRAVRIGRFSFVGWSAVDIAFMRRKLNEFIDTAHRSAELSRLPQEDYSLQSELRKQEYAVKQILRASDFIGTPHWDTSTR